MEKSIETIWKEGFLKSDVLLAPKLNDLYNQKSNHIMDKFKRMFKKNLQVVIVVGILFFIISYIVGVPYVGGFMLLLFAWIVYLGIKNISTLEEIDKGETSYQYLKAFDNWLKAAIQSYAKIYRFVYPLFFLSFMLGFWFSNIGAHLRDEILNDPDTLLIFGIPILWVAPILLFALLFSLFSNKIYQLDINSVYGHLIKKLDELITDMEELRS